MMNTVLLHMLECWGFVTCWMRLGVFWGFVGCGESRVDLGKGKGREISWRSFGGDGDAREICLEGLENFIDCLGYLGCLGLFWLEIP